MNDRNNIDNYIERKEIYNENYMREYEFLNDIDTIAVKATMGLGKTKKLHNLFNKYKNKKIVIVSFRITLDKEYINNFDDFKLYSDIKETTYDTDINNRIVVQIDSFHRIRGKIDLLVLDEFTYTAMHLVDRVKYKEAVYNTLLEYFNNISTKIIIMDALLDLETIKWVSKRNRKIHYIENKYSKHSDKIVYRYNDKIGLFTEKIIENIKKGKKLIVPTNSKNYLKNLELKLKTRIPNIKCKFLDSDNSDDINIDNWNKYDIVGYTPTIVAGVSYEKFHFHKCFGYFVNLSAPAEMALQQLFRVRNIEDNEYHICVEQKSKEEYPTNSKELEKYIIDKNKCLVDGVLGVKISRINKDIYRDSYFYLYKNCQMKFFKSKNEYDNTLFYLLAQQGIHKYKIFVEKNFDLDKLLRKEIRETTKNNKNCNVKDIINSEDIDDDSYNILKNKTNLTYNEKI